MTYGRNKESKILLTTNRHYLVHTNSSSKSLTLIQQKNVVCWSIKAGRMNLLFHKGAVLHPDERSSIRDLCRLRKSLRIISPPTSKPWSYIACRNPCASKEMKRMVLISSIHSLKSRRASKIIKEKIFRMVTFARLSFFNNS